MTKAEFTAIIKKQGNSSCIFIPMEQKEIADIKVGDVVKVTISKVEKR